MDDSRKLLEMIVERFPQLAELNPQEQLLLAGELVSQATEIESKAGTVKSAEYNFINHANRLAVTGAVDTALDIVYDQVDALLKKGRFGKIDAALDSVQTEDSTIDILLALLTTTLPAKAALSRRDAFFSRVHDYFKKNSHDTDALLTGLE